MTSAPESFVTALVTTSNKIFLLTNFLVYQSSDFGETWSQLPNPQGFLLTSLAVIENRLFAGTLGNGVITANLAPARGTAVNAASYAGGELGSHSIATMFGTNLSSATIVASGNNLPIELGGTRVIVRASNFIETPAKLFFVSPGQINFLMPELGANAVPTQIFVSNGSETVAVSDIRINDAALGLFAANGNGQGAPAAVALRIQTDGATTYEPVTRFDGAQNRFVPLPLDVSTSNGSLYLVLYGTGIDRRVTLSNMTASAGGQTLPVLYAGPQGAYAGLDQINLGLPSSLAGRGEVDLKITVNGKAANILRVAFK